MTTIHPDELANPTKTLSEHASKQLVATYGARLPREALAPSAASAAREADAIGYPVVLKLAGEGIAHKTERNLVRVGLADAKAVEAEARDLLSRARPEDGEVSLLVAEMVRGQRELIAGFVRDPQFGPCVLLGLGGVLAEALGDAVFAVAPLERAEAFAMIEGLETSHLFTKPHRGEPAIDREMLADLLEGLSRMAIEHPEIESVDLNPLIVAEGEPVAVDALVEQRAEGAPERAPLADALSDEAILERFRPLFHPKGIIVAGVSGHPGKFGFVTFHNLLRFDYRGELFGVKPDAAEVLGRPTLSSVEEVPADAADLVFVCTPNKANIGLLRDCAKKAFARPS